MRLVMSLVAAALSTMDESASVVLPR